MRPIRPKPLIPTLIVIYSTSYLLVNKRLVVKLQKPYQASSGIVSILAANQITGLDLLAYCTFRLRSASSVIWGQTAKYKVTLLHICDRYHITPRRDLYALQFRPKSTAMLLIFCYYYSLFSLTLSTFRESRKWLKTQPLTIRPRN
ncbi:hypothetical protein CT690_03345 [Serratia plymuthica]|uniref:Uncharacterized protein n=1 Tax=Serratia plymuthica TaxID=82996 RepID=A0A318P9J0_SERPL|nr:hypothetical protein CT690_03345 [Serratia plymuthica]